MFNDVQDAIDFASNKGKYADDGGIPLFRYEAVEIRGSDPVEYEDVVMVRIINKGDPKSVIERPKRKEDEKRWPNHWKAFQEGTEAPLDGIPLKEFPALTPADIANCQRVHIRVVEDLAKYPDGQLHNLGSRGVSLKKAATEFIAYRKKGGMDALLKRIEELESQIGNDKGNLSERAVGDGVQKPKRNSRKQQSRRKKDPADSEDSSEDAG